jgi:hypothetical protein
VTYVKITRGDGKKQLWNLISVESVFKLLQEFMKFDEHFNSVIVGGTNKVYVRYKRGTHENSV